MQPLTKWEKRIADDQRAKALYRRRRDIERAREQRELRRQINEVWA